MAVFLGRLRNLVEGYQRIRAVQGEFQRRSGRLRHLQRLYTSLCQSIEDRVERLFFYRFLFLGIPAITSGCWMLTLLPFLLQRGAFWLFLLTTGGGLALVSGLTLFVIFIFRLWEPVPFSSKKMPSIPDPVRLWLAQCQEQQHPLSPLTIERGGWIGEENLVAFLQRALPDTYLGIASLRIAGKDDIDVLLLTPKGLWVLESKYWRGEIGRLDDGRWYQMSSGEFEWRRPPDQQVLYLRNRVRSLLKRLFPRYPWTSWVHGAVIFTHPERLFRFESSPPVLCGSPGDFLKHLQAHPKVEALTFELRLQIAEALFLHESSFFEGAGRYWRGDAILIAHQIRERSLGTIVRLRQKMESRYRECVRHAPRHLTAAVIQSTVSARTRGPRRTTTGR